MSSYYSTNRIEEAEDAGFALGEKSGYIDGRNDERKKTKTECLAILRTVGHFHAAKILEETVEDEV